MGKDDFELIGGTKAGFCKERADDEEAVARQKKPPFPAATNGRALFINQSPSQQKTIITMKDFNNDKIAMS